MKFLEGIPGESTTEDDENVVSLEAFSQYHSTTAFAIGDRIIIYPAFGFRHVAAPAFLTKTFKIVEDAATNSVISWSSGGNSFIVKDVSSFCLILKKHFKHGNFNSFVRQLYNYSFRKVDADRWEFAHPGFLAGQKDLLRTIRRKIAPMQKVSGCNEGETKLFNSEIRRLTLLLHEVIDRYLAMKGKQPMVVEEESGISPELQRYIHKYAHKKQVDAAIEQKRHGPTITPSFLNSRELEVTVSPELQTLYDEYSQRVAPQIQIGRKRRFTTTASVENLQELDGGVGSIGNPFEAAMVNGDSSQEDDLKFIDDFIEILPTDFPVGDTSSNTSAGVSSRLTEKMPATLLTVPLDGTSCNITGEGGVSSFLKGIEDAIDDAYIPLGDWLGDDTISITSEGVSSTSLEDTEDIPDTSGDNTGEGDFSLEVKEEGGHLPGESTTCFRVDNFFSHEAWSHSLN